MSLFVLYIVYSLKCSRQLRRMLFQVRLILIFDFLRLLETTRQLQGMLTPKDALSSPSSSNL